MSLKRSDMNECCPKGICGQILYCKDNPCEDSADEFDPERCACTQSCNSIGDSVSGGDAGFFDSVRYRNIPQGSFLVVSYDTFTVRDNVTISGGANFSTGCTGSEGTVSLPLSPGDGSFTVSVVACESGTGWNLSYRIACG